MQFTHRGVSLFIWALALCAQRAGQVTDPEHAQARKQIQWKPIAGYLNAGTGDQRVYLKIA
jgi:hypothetical protein